MPEVGKRRAAQRADMAFIAAVLLVGVCLSVNPGRGAMPSTSVVGPRPTISPGARSSPAARSSRPRNTLKICYTRPGAHKDPKVDMGDKLRQKLLTEESGSPHNYNWMKEEEAEKIRECTDPEASCHGLLLNESDGENELVVTWTVFSAPTKNPNKKQNDKQNDQWKCSPHSMWGRCCDEWILNIVGMLKTMATDGQSAR